MYTARGVDLAGKKKYIYIFLREYECNAHSITECEWSFFSYCVIGKFPDFYLKVVSDIHIHGGWNFERGWTSRHVYIMRHKR